jgi:RNA polymerase sigma-70 factor (ECF subfamily)
MSRLQRLKNAKLSDEELMRRVQQEHLSAFDEIYQRYHRRLFSYFVRMLGANPAKAEDFLQDTFLKIIENARSFQPDLAFSTWLFTIARNLCKNEYRRQSTQIVENREDLDALPGELLPPEQRVERAFFRQALFRALLDLKPEPRDTFLLRYQQHFSLKEISEIMECSEGTVKSRLFYTLKNLSRRLQAFNPNEVHEDE